MKKNTFQLRVTLMAILLFGGILFTISAQAQNPFAKVKTKVKHLTIQGEDFVQRDLTYYIMEVASKTNPDYLKDKEEVQWADFLNRPHPTRATLRSYFTAASKEFGVPVEILMAIGYVESNWTQMGPSMDKRWGVMRLAENNYCNTLSEGSELIGTSTQVLKDNAHQNIRAAAALLAKYAKEDGKSLKTFNDWFPVIKKYSGHISEYTRELAAKSYFKVLKNGVKSESLWNEKYELPAYKNIDIDAKLVEINKKEAEKEASLKVQKLTNIKGTKAYDEWYAGATKDETVNQSTRSAAIDVWVNHWMGTGTFAGAISWFHNTDASASAHFCIDTDGTLVQMVGISKKAWHATVFNSRAIGIEHYATAVHPEYWESTPMLIKSAEVARHYCDQLSIPKIRKFEVYEAGIFGHTDIPTVSKNCPGPMPWDRWFGYLGGAVPPAQPTLLSVENYNGNAGLKVTWTANTETDLASYKIYTSTNEAQDNFILLATIPAGTEVYTNDNFAASSTGYNVKITAVNDDGDESPASDTYARLSNSNANGLRNILIVDAFDISGGSFTASAHSFTTTYMRALRDAGGAIVSSCANEAIINGSVLFSDYDLVVWYNGDESQVGITFSVDEQNKVKMYLEAGGKMLVSGSEIAYDLDNKGNATDKAFIANYLKATYDHDGGSTAPAVGLVGGSFEGTSLTFGNVYPEDYADEITPANGSVGILTYTNPESNGIGGVAYKGTFGAGTAEGGMVYVAFPLETVSYEAAIKVFMIKLFDFIGPVVNDGTPTARFEITNLPAKVNAELNFDATTSADNNGGVLTYAWNFGDGATGTGVNPTHTYLATGTKTVSLTVTSSSNFKTNTTSKQVVVAAESVDDIVIDNLDTEAVALGNWTTGSYGTDMYAADYLFSDVGTGNSVTYTPNITKTANYEVFIWYTEGENRATNTAVVINHNGEVSNLTVNQEEPGSTWRSLGVFAFAEGTTGNVVIKNDGADEIVIADALKFTYDSEMGSSTPDIIIDDKDAEAVNLNFANSSAGYEGTNGTGSLYASGAFGGKSVTFTPNIQLAGNYEISAIYVSRGNATTVPVDVNYNGGSTTVQLDQTQNGESWFSLGNYNLALGTSGSVVIRNDGITGEVSADAIKFVYLGTTTGIADNFNLLDAKIYSYGNEIFIKLNETDNAEIKIYNILGSEVYSEKFNSTEKIISLNKKGIFIVKLRVNEKVMTGKVILK